MRRRAVVVGLVLALVGAAPAAGDDPVEEKRAVDVRIASLRDEIEAAKEKEGVLPSQLTEVVAELDAAQAAVDRAQGSLDQLEAELASEQARLERLTLLLREQTEKLRDLEEQHARAVEILQTRVRAIYIEGPQDALSVIVSARSLGDMIDSYEFMSRIGRQDRRIANEVEALKLEAAAKRRATARTQRLAAATVSAISARTEEARVVRNELTANRDTLAAARRLKRSALADTRESREEYLDEVEGLLAQSARLAAAIREA
jgi:peptidoglycan hydrolase CwlO-like protein